MDDSKDLMKQCLSSMHEYMSKLMENPKAFEDILNPIMNMQEKLIGENKSLEQEENKVTTTNNNLDIEAELRKLKKRIIRLERKVLVDEKNVE